MEDPFSTSDLASDCRYLKQTRRALYLQNNRARNSTICALIVAGAALLPAGYGFYKDDTYTKMAAGILFALSAVSYLRGRNYKKSAQSNSELESKLERRIASGKEVIYGRLIDGRETEEDRVLLGYMRELGLPVFPGSIDDDSGLFSELRPRLDIEEINIAAIRTGIAGRRSKNRQ